MALPKKLYDVNDKHDSEDNTLQSSEGEFVKKTEELLNRKYVNSTNLENIKTLFKVFQHGQLACDFPAFNTGPVIALPMISVSTERFFSKLKLIKTRLRITMAEERLEELMIS